MNKLIKTLLTYVLIFIVLTIFLFPFYWMLISSFKPFDDLMMGDTSLIPKKVTLKGYFDAFRPLVAAKDFGLFAKNSLIICISSMILTIIPSMISGYVFTRFKFRGSKFLYKIMLFAYLFPYIVLILPLSVLMTWLNLINTHIGLIITYVAVISPFCTWLFTSFFKSIPLALEEAALIDGCNRLQVFLKIVIPLSAPAILTASTYAFLTSWGDYLFALVMIYSDHNKTIPLGLAMYMEEQYIEWGQLLAGTVISVLPVVLIFLPLAKLFLKGFTGGAIKG
ncbi:MAG: carbohydrate ABC transporter permease [Candidatus Methanomethylicaceae archaeon]